MAQRVGRGIALLFLDRGTRRGREVCSTPRPHFTPGKDPVPILQEAGWAPGPVWRGGTSRPHRDSIPDRPTRSQSLYRLSYPAHIYIYIYNIVKHNFIFYYIILYYNSSYMFWPNCRAIFRLIFEQVECTIDNGFSCTLHLFN